MGDYSGVSKSSPVGIATMKESGEGRRYHGCTDHLAMQASEMEAINRGEFTEEAPLKVVETDTFAGHAMRELLGPGSQEDERLFFDRNKQSNWKQDPSRLQGTSLLV